MNNEAKIYGGVDITAARRAQKRDLRKAQEKGLRDPKCSVHERELSRAAFIGFTIVPQIEATPQPGLETDSDIALSEASVRSACENPVEVVSPEVWREALQTKDGLSVEGIPSEDKA